MRNSPSLIALASLFAMVQTPLAALAASEPKLEVFSWWTSGGEAAALDALFNVYKDQNAGVEIVNATGAGGGGAAGRPVLQNRFSRGNIPANLQTLPGCELLRR